jgi:6-phosphofructokinase 1
MKSIAVLTSGGDAPGMNAAIRAVVRTAIHNGIKVFGVNRGYQGLIDADIFEMYSTSVSNIIQRGGTVLKTARSKDFKTPEGRQQAYDNLKRSGVEGLILIGGDGTFKGANEFFKEHALPAVGIPGTIDNDIAGTDYTLGFDTAVNTAVNAIDKIRDTAEAHDRIFIVEVMGRDAGYIALHSGIACGAEDILIPEKTAQIEEVLEGIDYDQRRKKLMRIIVVAEGDEFGAIPLQKRINRKFPDMEVRVAILGHIQRGGSPTYYDRVMASRMGYEAVNALLCGQTQVMIGVRNEKIVYTPFSEAVKEHAVLDTSLLEMAKVLSS